MHLSRIFLDELDDNVADKEEGESSTTNVTLEALIEPEMSMESMSTGYDTEHVTKTVTELLHRINILSVQIRNKIRMNTYALRMDKLQATSYEALKEIRKTSCVTIPSGAKYKDRLMTLDKILSQLTIAYQSNLAINTFDLIQSITSTDIEITEHNYTATEIPTEFDNNTSLFFDQQECSNISNLMNKILVDTKKLDEHIATATNALCLACNNAVKHNSISNQEIRTFLYSRCMYLYECFKITLLSIDEINACNIIHINLLGILK